MTPVHLKPVSEVLPHAQRVVARAFARLGALLPHAELHHIGATALPRGVTKGDVDVLVRVSSATEFVKAVAILREHFAIRQPANWTDHFASFGDDTGYELPLGVQLVVKGSADDFLLFLRDYFLRNTGALDEYNRLKAHHAHEGPEAYWKAKDTFLMKILASRTEDE